MGCAVAPWMNSCLCIAHYHLYTDLSEDVEHSMLVRYILSSLCVRLNHSFINISCNIWDVRTYFSCDDHFYKVVAYQVLRSLPGCTKHGNVVTNSWAKCWFPVISLNLHLNFGIAFTRETYNRQGQLLEYIITDISPTFRRALICILWWFLTQYLIISVSAPLQYKCRLYRYRGSL